MNHAKQGFTVIELMLAMTFISILLVTIALSILQIAGIYNNGMTLREVNEAGRNISDQVRRDMTTGNINSLAQDYYQSTSGGRLCVGTYSYVWNYEPALQSGGPTDIIKYETSSDPIRLVRIQDPSRSYCLKDVTGFTYKTIRAVDQPRSTELLQSGERFLSIYDFSIPSGSVVSDPLTKQSLFELTFRIGTGDQDALTADKLECKPGPDFNYCATQAFTLVIRAGSGV
jgi:competence protein ComGC